MVASRPDGSAADVAWGANRDLASASAARAAGADVAALPALPARPVWSDAADMEAAATTTRTMGMATAVARRARFNCLINMSPRRTRAPPRCHGTFGLWTWRRRADRQHRSADRGRADPHPQVVVLRAALARPGGAAEA